MSHRRHHQATPQKGRRKNLVLGRQILTRNGFLHVSLREYREVTAPILMGKGSGSLDDYGIILDAGNHMTGRVKWFNQAKGYGFIEMEKDGGEDIFVHCTEIKKEGCKFLTEGQIVEFEIEIEKGGKRKNAAVNVVVLSDNALNPPREVDFFGQQGGSIARLHAATR